MLPVGFEGIVPRHVADDAGAFAMMDRPGLSSVVAASAIAVLLAIGGFGFTLWLDQGEALFVRLAADAWASCF